MYVGFSFLPPAYPTWVDRIPRGKRINRFSEHQKQPIPNITFSDLSGNGGYLFLYIFQKQNTFIISSVLSTPGPLYPPRKSDSNPMVNLEAALKNSPPQTPRSPMFPETEDSFSWVYFEKQNGDRSGQKNTNCFVRRLEERYKILHCQPVLF